MRPRAAATRLTRFAAGAAAVTATSGCFALVPVPSGAPIPPGDVRLHLTPEGSARLAGSGFGGPTLDGRVVRTEGGVLVLAVVAVGRADRPTVDTLRVAVADVAVAERRRLARGRTAVVYGSLAALAVVVVRGLTGASGGAGGPPGEPPGTGTSGG